jgi:glycosyltransferase involved in cell wall biosynthesis
VNVSSTTQKVMDVLHDLKPDIVHAHNIHAFIGYPVLPHARSCNAKVFLTAHDTYLVSFARVDQNAYRTSVQKKLPYRMRWFDHLASVGFRYWPLRNASIKRFLAEGDVRVIVYADATKEFLSANGILNLVKVNGLTPVFAQPTAEDIMRFKQTHSIAGGPVILFGGRISHAKGIDALLHAFAALYQKASDAQLLIVGEERRFAPHRKNVPEHLHGNIKVTDWIPFAAMPTAYAAADIVTTPSIYLDNFPTINVEAMSLKKPVVGTCFGGTPEAVEHNVNGLIVNPDDTEEYAAALLTLVRDGGLRARMGEAGAERGRARFSRDMHVDALLSMYAEE